MDVLPNRLLDGWFVANVLPKRLVVDWFVVDALPAGCVVMMEVLPVVEVFPTKLPPVTG